KIAPDLLFRRIGAHDADEIEKQAEAYRQLGPGDLFAARDMDMVRGVSEALVGVLRKIVSAHLEIFVDRLRDYPDMELLRRLGLAIGVKGEAFLAAIVEPLLEAEAIAFRLRDLLALFVEEHLVDQPLGLAAAE